MTNMEKKYVVDELMDMVWKMENNMLCKDAVKAKLQTLANELRNEIIEDATK